MQVTATNVSFYYCGWVWLPCMLVILDFDFVLCVAVGARLFELCNHPSLTPTFWIFASILVLRKSMRWCLNRGRERPDIHLTLRENSGRTLSSLWAWCLTATQYHGISDSLKTWQNISPPQSAVLLQCFTFAWTYSLEIPVLVEWLLEMLVHPATYSHEHSSRFCIL